MEFQWFVAYVGVPGFLILVGWNVWLQKRMSNTEHELSNFMLDAAKTYVTKEDMRTFAATLNSRFDKIDHKLEQLDRYLRNGRKTD